jgi:hypothetical protein
MLYQCRLGFEFKLAAANAGNHNVTSCNNPCVYHTLKTLSLHNINGNVQIHAQIITALVRPLLNIISITHMTFLQGFCD